MGASRISAGLLACGLLALSQHVSEVQGRGAWGSGNATNAGQRPVSLAVKEDSPFHDCHKTDEGLLAHYKCSRTVKGADGKGDSTCVYTCDNDASASGECHRGLSALAGGLLHAPECGPAPNKGSCPHELTVLGFEELVVADHFPHPGTPYETGPNKTLTAPRAARFVDVQSPGPFNYRGVEVQAGFNFSDPDETYEVVLVDSQFDYNRLNVLDYDEPRRISFSSLNSAYVSTSPVNLVVNTFNSAGGTAEQAPAKIVFTFPQPVTLSSVFIGQPNTAEPHVSLYGDGSEEAAGCKAEVYPPGDAFPYTDPATGVVGGVAGHGGQYNFKDCKTKTLTVVGNAESDFLFEGQVSGDWFLSIDSLIYC